MSIESVEDIGLGRSDELCGSADSASDVSEPGPWTRSTRSGAITHLPNFSDYLGKYLRNEKQDIPVARRREAARTEQA